MWPIGKGQGLRLLHHMKKEHLDATRDGARSLLKMEFTRQAIGGASHTAHDDVDDGNGDQYCVRARCRKPTDTIRNTIHGK
jgi:hypothetical protein